MNYEKEVHPLLFFENVLIKVLKRIRCIKVLDSFFTCKHTEEQGELHLWGFHLEDEGKKKQGKHMERQRKKEKDMKMNEDFHLPLHMFSVWFLVLFL